MIETVTLNAMPADARISFPDDFAHCPSFIGTRIGHAHHGEDPRARPHVQLEVITEEMWSQEIYTSHVKRDLSPCLC